MLFLRWMLPVAAFALLAAPAAAGYGDPDLATVRHVDLPRFMGRWYVVAHVPNLLETGKVALTETFSQLPDGSLRDVMGFRRHGLSAQEQAFAGPAWVTDFSTNASWKLRLFWPFWPFASGYHVLELDPNYGWAVTASDSGSLYWVLARTPQLDVDTYREIIERLRRRRLDPARLEMVPQPAASN